MLALLANPFYQALNSPAEEEKYRVVAATKITNLRSDWTALTQLTDVFTLYIFRFLDYKPVPEDQSSKQETIEEASEARGKIWLCPGWTLLVLLPSHYQQPVAYKIACSHVPCIQDLINNFHV